MKNFSEKFYQKDRDFQSSINNMGNEGRGRETAGFFSSKGQSQLVMQALAVAFSLIMIWLIMSIMNSIIDDHREFVGKKEILQACDIMKTGIEKLMIQQDYASRSNTTLGKIFIAMPGKIGGIEYRTSFVNDTMFVETFGPPSINDTCIMGFNATFKGGTAGGKTEITRFRYNNGTDEVTVTSV